MSEWVFNYLLYPMVVIGIFLYIISMQIIIIRSAKNQFGRVRRLTGALLPIVTLIFLVSSNKEAISQVLIQFENFSGLKQFLVGAATGLLLLESGKFLLESQTDTAASIHALFLSSFGSFLLWAITRGMLTNLNLTLLGLVLASGLHIIFRGPPETQ